MDTRTKMWDDFQPLSSHIDWCETNYATIPIIAEFWNTVSNALFFIIPPILICLFKQYARQVCGGVYLVWVLLIVVGFGSAFFHSTLSFVGQMVDELAILWVCMSALATWVPTKYLPKQLAKDRRKYQALVIIVATTASIAAFIKPEFNHAFLFTFGVPAVGLLVKELRRCECPRVYKVGITSAVWWGIGVLCWFSDRFMCRMWADVLHFPYLHSAWHIMVCLGSYMACVCFAYFFATHEVPEQCPTLKFWPHDSHTWFGIPYVALKVTGSKPIKSF